MSELSQRDLELKSHLDLKSFSATSAKLETDYEIFRTYIDAG